MTTRRWTTHGLSDFYLIFSHEDGNGNGDVANIHIKAASQLRATGDKIKVKQATMLR